MFRFGDLFISLLIVVGATIGAVTYLTPGSERTEQPIADDLMEVPDEGALAEPDIDETGMTDFASEVAEETEEMVDEILDEATLEGEDVASDADSESALPCNLRSMAMYQAPVRSPGRRQHGHSAVRDPARIQMRCRSAADRRRGRSPDGRAVRRAP